MNRELLDKWLNGTISPSELEVLKQDPVFEDYLKIDSHIKRLDLPAKSSSEGLKELKERLAPPTKKKVFRLNPWMKFAAAAVLILMVGYFYLANLPSRFETQLAETEIVELPDTSQVTLNENSYLEFRKNKWDEDRLVNLAGEAFFEVANGKRFEVHTEHGVVSVLGTKFNVSDRDGVFKVTCFEGLVKVTHNGDEKQLAAGDVITFMKDARFSEKKYTTRPGWIFDESSFENAKLAWVLAELETVYSINVNTENIDVDLQYTGSFTNTNLDSALQTITLPLRLDYVIENKNVILVAKD